MRSIDSVELARMTAVAVESLNDRCDIYHFIGGQDSDTGEIKDQYDSSPSLAVACGLAVGSELRNERGQIVTIDADAVLRVPATQTINVGDRIIARSKTYQADGVTPGRNVQVVKLMEIKI